MIYSRPGRRCAVLAATFLVVSQFVGAALAQNTSQLSGYVYIDRNNDGVLAFSDQPMPELVLPNVSIQLYSISGSTATLLSTTQTNSIGQYLFSNLAAGTYALNQIQPVEFVDGLDTVGQIRSLMGPMNPAGSAVGTAGNNFFTGIVLTAGSRGDLYNFGERGVAPAFVSKRFVLSSAPPPVFAPTPQIPEPASCVLGVLAGLGGVAALRRRGS